MKAKSIERNVTQRLSIWAMVVAAILMIPVLAQFPWTRGDFIFAGSVLFGAAAIYEITTQSMGKTERVVAGFAVAFFVLLIWAWAVA